MGRPQVTRSSPRAPSRAFASGETQLDNYLPSDVFGDLLALLREHGPPMIYVDSYHESTDILTERRDLTHEF